MRADSGYFRIMRLFDLTPGFIAAALVVLGTGQGVNETSEKTSPEQNESKALASERWALVDVAGATDPENPTAAEQTIVAILDENSNPQAPCSDQSGEVCATKLMIPDDADPESFEGQTVAQALSNGASYPTSGIEQSHRN